MIRLLSGDCRDVLPTLAAGSVHTVVTSPPYYALRSYLDASHPDKHRELGSEATPEAYIAAMAGVFREVRRVLRRDGTCWVNMGDSYASSMTSDRRMFQPTRDTDRSGGVATQREPQIPGRCTTGNGIKPKDLLMMPARLALALQVDGWWVRSDIIISKKNPMPESARDRPTSAHEHLFLLTKQPRYYIDMEAIREKTDWASKMPDGWNTGAGGHGTVHPNGREAGANNGACGTSRNARNVWEISTFAYKEAHFATFSPELPERCILAGTSERGCCAACGAPWVRITDTSYTDAHRGMVGNQRKGVTDDRVMHAGREDDVRMDKHVATVGWRAGCGCNAETVPCTVLDPFSGSGTTLLVADRLQRDAIGIDLSATYADMARNRIEADCPLFTSFPPAEDPEDMRMRRDLFDMAAD